MSGGEANVTICGFREEHAEAFAALNYAWIERYFAIEDEDRKVLENPQGYVLAPGGEIFFALAGAEAVGTVAMVPVAADVFELAKMAVTPAYQGRGVSRLLMRRCIDFARERNAREILLVTNDSLAPALGLYLSTGFVAAERLTDARYARGNLEMRLTL